MKFRPLHDRVVVRRIDAEEKSAGGIIIPDTAKEKPMQGEVVAAGPGARNDAGKVEPLDIGVLSAKGSLYVTRPTLMTYTATPEDFRHSASRVIEIDVKPSQQA